MIEPFRLADTMTSDLLTTTIDSWGYSSRPKPQESAHESRPHHLSGPESPVCPISQRRSEPRFAPVSDRVWVQWREGDDYFGRSARMVNVSRHGSMLLGTMPLPDQQRVRLFLEDLTPTYGIDAVVISIVVGSKGLHQLHLIFEHACPDTFLEAAAKGFEAWIARHGTRT